MVSLKRRIVSNARNVISNNIRVPEKLIIFESDDWGNNRISSKNDYDKLVKQGVLSDNCSKYDKYNTIPEYGDFESLYDVLTSVKDKNGNHAIISQFINPVNPNYEQIADSGFSQYYYETCFETMDKKGLGKNVSGLWHEGINCGLVDVEYHGREHVSVPLWMEYLQKNNEFVKKAFSSNFYAAPEESLPSVASSFLTYLYYENEEQRESVKESLDDGFNVFYDMFQLKPAVFVAPNGLSSRCYNNILCNNGVLSMHNYTQLEDGRKMPHQIEKLLKGGNIIRYYTRNCAFEPVQVKFDAVDFCMAQVDAAFRWHKAAIVCSHAVNYLGGISRENREFGLTQLKKLLTSIVKKWPDVVFCSSRSYATSFLK